MITARTFLAVESLAFLLAALLHSGAVASYSHAKAATAETVIAIVLAAGLVVAMALPRAARKAAIGAQAFALLGTCVGIFTIAIGVGPQTVLDLSIHAGFIALLTTGLLRVTRASDPQLA